MVIPDALNGRPDEQSVMPMKACLELKVDSE